MVADLNRRIAEWLRTPSGPQVPVRPVAVDAVLAEWRAPEPATGPEPGAPQQHARRAWWRRRRTVPHNER